MRNLFAVILGLVLATSLFACVAKQRNILESSESQVKLRSMQSRVFDTTDRDGMLRTIIATLQDLGFVIDDADKNLGTVSGTKRSGYSLRMTVSIRPRGEHQTMVRCNAQYNLQTVEDPEPYQEFFSSLSKALFLDAQLLEGPSAGGAGVKQTSTKPGSQAGLQKLTAAPETGSMTKTTVQPGEAPKLASIPEEAPVVRVSLRRKPIEIQNDMKITDMVVEYDFFERYRNPRGSFKNVFVDNKDGTVTDKVTGLMWQKSGSSGALENRAAISYLEQLKGQRFAGHFDWRLPTIEELASLLERTRNEGVYLDSVFDSRQASCWSADKGEGVNQGYLGAWIVNFVQGQILKADFARYYRLEQSGGGGQLRKNNMNHVKAVRSLW